MSDKPYLSNGENNLPFFDKGTTCVLKGVALLLIFYHHFFTFPSWWMNGVTYPDLISIAPFCCSSTKICVSIFCFLTGYFYFYSKRKTYTYSFKKISDILISYWTVCFLFSALAVILLGYHYNITSFAEECFALDCPTMVFCWYVRFYITFMSIMPLIVKLMGRGVHIDLLLAFFVVPLLMRFGLKCLSYCLSYLPAEFIILDLHKWFPIVLLGVIFARYDLFSKLSRAYHAVVKKKYVDVILTLLIIILALMGRALVGTLDIEILHYVWYVNMDVLYVPMFIYGVVNLCGLLDLKYIKIPLMQIGKYSLLMWFISCIFFGNCKSVFQPILYYPHNILLIMIWGTILCYVPAVILQKGISRVQKWKDRYLFGRGEVSGNAAN